MQATSFIGGLTLATLADRNLGPCAALSIASWWIIGGIAVLSLVFVCGHGFNLAIVAVAGFSIIGAPARPEQFHGGPPIRPTSAPAASAWNSASAGWGPFSDPTSSGFCSRRQAVPTPYSGRSGGAAMVGGLAIGSLGIRHAALPRRQYDPGGGAMTPFVYNGAGGRGVVFGLGDQGRALRMRSGCCPGRRAPDPFGRRPQRGESGSALRPTSARVGRRCPQ